MGEDVINHMEIPLSLLIKVDFIADDYDDDDFIMLVVVLVFLLVDLDSADNYRCRLLRAGDRLAGRAQPTSAQWRLIIPLFCFELF